MGNLSASGINKVVFVIRKDLEKDFKEMLKFWKDIYLRKEE